MAETILHRLRAANGILAILIGILLFACVAFVLADIILRRMGSTLGGTDEVSGYVMAIATAWGMAYTLTELGHVRIDILRSRVQARGRALFDLFSMLVLSGTISLIALQAWPVVSRSISNGSRANTNLETPLALVQMPWFLGWVWFALASWITLFAAASLVMKGKYDATDAAIGTFGEADQLK
ncbi:TRAP-type mannitol/chloroaromatic compound transport system, small permease component [Roseivivax lentus]|uniref:TRAP transporter small permease protein n=1 Tax=Roseivivax lentus TaxID=633194 RepID=A0A1N7LXN1_9RHOB|nr:TRAP transporter small permease [Roseivivax lentus]SIS78580.1 TRAP-type mannitol/chloroaromatic compound transport system, small permease component [Roseivivax lentus]